MAADSAGTWLARHRSDEGKQIHKPLGEFADLAPSASFDAASRSVRIYSAHCRPLRHYVCSGKPAPVLAYQAISPGTPRQCWPGEPSVAGPLRPLELHVVGDELPNAPCNHFQP